MQQTDLFYCISEQSDLENRMITDMSQVNEHVRYGHILIGMEDIKKSIADPNHPIKKIINKWDQQKLIQDVDQRIKQIKVLQEQNLELLSKKFKNQIFTQTNEFNQLRKYFKDILDDNTSDLSYTEQIINKIYKPRDDYLKQLKNQNESIQLLIKDQDEVFNSYNKKLEELKEILEELTQMNLKELYCISQQFNYYTINTFKIGQKEITALFEWLNTIPSKLNLQLLFRGSRDGFTGKAFHQKCDNQGPTLTLIKSEFNKVFGGFTTQNWDGTKHWQFQSDSQAFIFSLTHLTKHPVKVKDNAIYNRRDLLCIFGGVTGTDIAIYDSCNTNNNSFTNFPSCYFHHENKPMDETTKKYLAGENKFKVVEIETYKVIM